MEGDEGSQDGSDSDEESGDESGDETGDGDADECEGGKSDSEGTNFVLTFWPLLFDQPISICLLFNFTYCS